MKIVRLVGPWMLLASAMASAGALAASKAEMEEAMSHDGLQKVTVPGLAQAYARPGATLAGYGRVLIEPVQVAFSRNWDPTRTGSRLKLSKEERENIRNGVAAIDNTMLAESRSRTSPGNTPTLKPSASNTKPNSPPCEITAAMRIASARSSPPACRPTR